MGRAIESLIAPEDNIVARIDPQASAETTPSLSSELAQQADVIIEFSTPNAAIDNLKQYVEYGLPAIVGTTGWDASEYMENNRALPIPYLWSSNFSIGAYMLKKLSQYVAKWTNLLQEYDIMMHEYHHKLKKDSPSGTALAIAQAILAASDRKKKISSEPLQTEIDPSVLHVTATRGGSIPGTHTVTIDSPADSIQLSHIARTRYGFALGALRAARWIINQGAGFHTIEQFIEETLFSGTE